MAEPAISTQRPEVPHEATHIPANAFVRREPRTLLQEFAIRQMVQDFAGVWVTRTFGSATIDTMCGFSSEWSNTFLSPPLQLWIVWLGSAAWPVHARWIPLSSTLGEIAQLGVHQPGDQGMPGG